MLIQDGREFGQPLHRDAVDSHHHISDLMPAASAGPCGARSAITTPQSCASPSPSATGAVTVCATTPMSTWSTRPYSRRLRYTKSTTGAGIAKPKSFAAAAAADDEGVQADDRAGDVHQRASAVAAIDRRVGLQSTPSDCPDPAAATPN